MRSMIATAAPYVAHGERGATLVECTVVLPLYFLLAFGIVEFSRFAANRSQVQSALRQAGESGATLSSDCLYAAHDRFFEVMGILKSGSNLSFVGEVVPFAGRERAIRLTATGNEPTLLPGLTIPLRVVGVFPIEVPGGCADQNRLDSTSAHAVRSHPPPHPDRR